MKDSTRLAALAGKLFDPDCAVPLSDILHGFAVALSADDVAAPSRESAPRSAGDTMSEPCAEMYAGPWSVDR